MADGPKVSLLDLSKLLRFEIDDAMKEKICFGETLLISCGHVESEVVDDSDSEWSCRSTTDIEPEDAKRKNVPAYDIKETVLSLSESDKKSEPDDDNDFHVFFFPDCSKPVPPANSKVSLLIGPDGMPLINPARPPEPCVCEQDAITKECECFLKVPCLCGAETTRECTCAQLEGICVCRDGAPQVECTCSPSKVCICDPDNKVKPVCTCDQVKPCICDRMKPPNPICKCEYKPTDDDESYASVEGTEIDDRVKPEKLPCDCQKPEPPQIQKCLCLRGKKCTCNLICICDIQPKPCVCESVDGEQAICEGQESKSNCSCPQLCTCVVDELGVCKCFTKTKPTLQPQHCTCENPENCKCFSVCECTSPCICDVQYKKENECICPDSDSVECTCPQPDKPDLSPLKLKKVRAGKHDYRFCHDVDPRHTYFDYAYDRRDKITYKAENREKVNILGLHGDTAGPKTSGAANEIEAPPYKKSVRKQSIDCCSTLGGMSINVECLGESKDRFLVQVTSHFSKEGAKAGTKLVSILDCKLHTMEENRTEHITKKDIIKQRKSYMAICDTGYYNKITKVCGERHVVKRFYHTFEDAHKFLLEGANVVLLRYFALSRYRGKIQTDTVLMDGVVCESVYVCYGVSHAVVNGKTMFVCKVERHIIEASGVVHQTLSVLTLRGYLICHEWADNNYLIHINPLLNVVPEKDLIEEHAPLRKRWREDLQLLSDYLDFKSSRSAEGARYTSDSNTLSNSVRDYLQALLMLQPQDALHFTNHYFEAALSSFDLPHNDYFEESTKHVRYFFFED